jgi:hypothetical protein
MSFWRDMADDVAPTRGPAIQVATPSRVQAAVDTAFAQMQGQEQQDAADAAEEIRTLTEVERRLRKANYYQAILGQVLFEGGASEEAVEVEAEIREFALKRLRILIGIEAEIAPAPRTSFSHEEEVALKMWAGKILGKPAVLEPPAEEPRKSVLPPPPARPVPLPEAKLRPLVDQAATPVLKRRPGRPPGTGKHQRAAAAAATETTPTTPAAPKVVETEVTLPDGTTAKVQHDVSGPVRPAGTKPAPMPDPGMQLLMQQAEAQQKAARNPIVGQFVTAISGE